MENDALIKDIEFNEINKLYDECLNYLKKFTTNTEDSADFNKNIVKETSFNNNNNNEDEASFNNNTNNEDAADLEYKVNKNDEIKTTRKEIEYKIENEIRKAEELIEHPSRLRRLSHQLPKIIITQSNSSLSKKDDINKVNSFYKDTTIKKEKKCSSNSLRSSLFKPRHGYGDFPKRLVSKSGMENVALISNVPFEKIRLLNDTFHTLINLRWRWIVIGTIVVHFAIWLVFAMFWYVTALAHYDFEPDPPARACVTGGRDFLTIFLASVEAQTTIGFGDRAIDEECPESIFLFIMQLILGTGLSGVLTCVVYAKLTRPEKLSRDGVGFSKKAVISMRDGHLCLMIRAWDLNYDHIIGSEFSAHFINTHKTKEGDMIRYYTKTLTMQTRQFLLWPVILVHIIDESSPLYKYTPDMAANSNYEITVSLKGASASMGTFTQSQTSYTPREIMWGHRFPPVVKYDSRKQKYVIDHKKLNATEPVETPICSAHELYSCIKAPGGEVSSPPSPPPETPSSFSDKISSFVLERSSSFRYSKKY